MTTPIRFFSISRWKILGTVVKVGLAYDTATEAEAAGRKAEATYGDQKFERVFKGTWLEYGALCK